eukprot:scaffold120583_cov56-Attheya_sp.AAC.2
MVVGAGDEVGDKVGDKVGDEVGGADTGREGAGLEEADSGPDARIGVEGCAFRTIYIVTAAQRMPTSSIGIQTEMRINLLFFILVRDSTKLCTT